MPSARADVLRRLAERIREMESADYSPGRPRLSLGSRVLDGLLPDGQLPAGSLIELLSEAPGAGVWTLALIMGRPACGRCKALVVADRARCFYPPAALKLGIDLTRMIVVRPRTWRDAYVALDQSLRCRAVGAVVGWCEEIATADYRRLQLAAETGGGVGLLLRPAEALRSPSFAALRLRVGPVVKESGGSSAARPTLHAGIRVGWVERSEAHRSSSRRVRIEVVRCRGGKDGRSLVVEIDDETGDVRLPAPLAAPAAAARAAGSPR